MRLKLLVAIVGIYEAAAIGLAQMEQTDIPSGLLDMARDFPVLFVVMVVAYAMAKWSDRMITTQTDVLQRVYGDNQKFLSDLIVKLEVRQNTLEDSIVAMNSMMHDVKCLIEDKTERRNLR